MGARFRLWWQKARKPIDVIGFVVVFVVAIALIFIEVISFGTGFKGKTLWDWLQLLIIPVVLALGGYFFTYTISKNERKAADRHNQTEREIAQDNQREAALQEYIDKMSELLLHEKLRESQPEDEVRKIARVRTLTVLPRLDGKRKGSVIQFLYESGLIEKKKTIIDLHGADLTCAELKTFLNEVNLSNALLTDSILTLSKLKNARMSNAILTGALIDYADLSYADLQSCWLNKTDMFLTKFDSANLSFANLIKANLSDASFRGANLYNADLLSAIVDVKDLEEQAKSLKGARMPNGSIHP